jgi:L-2,4-diaminobutyric acid acetyltransferase
MDKLKQRSKSNINPTDEIIIISNPVMSDGQSLWELAKEAGNLDLNSAYCYNLVSTHFSHTSAITKCRDKPVGFTSAYLLPDSNHELFIWQIVVSPDYQGQGIAFKMIKSILAKELCKKVTVIKTTISPSNTPSLRLFQKVSQSLNLQMSVTPYFSSANFPGFHEDENLVTIGPFDNNKSEEDLYDN